jgi:diguanylate cyclase (GGDEF)-like protein
VVRLNGHPVFEQSGEFRGYRGVGSDVTAAHNLSKQLSHEVSHDSLTGLVNRREFERRLDRVLATARDHETEHALCYLDLDQFKVVNDTSGHVAGDELLRQLGAVLRGQVRKRDTLARLGGDEFGVLVEHCTLREAQRVAETLLHAIEDFRFSWEDKGFSLGVSIGLVPINAGSGTMTDVLRQADSACYVAKDLGRSRIHLYQPDDEALARQQGEIQWVSRINTALVEDRFALTCQQIRPIGDTADTRLHCELLLRMVEADGSLISPGSFLPAAERFNLATRLDRWVVKHAFGWLRDNPRLVDRLGLCSINLSGQSVGDGDFLGFVSDLLVSHSVPTDRICFEITETAAVANLTAASQFINSLRAKGCQFALDDFGSGLSSFNYLKHLPVDYLKIDGVFVRDIVTDPVDLAMVRSINEMGHVLGKRTIAEFVEDQPILDRLRELGVDYAQGYHIGRPRPLSDFD